MLGFSRAAILSASFIILSGSGTHLSGKSLFNFSCGILGCLYAVFFTRGFLSSDKAAIALGGVFGFAASPIRTHSSGLFTL